MSASFPVGVVLAKRWAARTPRVRGVLAALTLGFTIVVLGYLSVELSPEGSSVAAWWPAAGVAVAVVTTRWSMRWPMLVAVLAATAVANLAAGRPGAVAAGFAVTNAIEVWVVAWWLHRVGRDDGGLRSIRDLVLFGVGAAFGALTIGVGATVTISRFGTGDPVAAFANVVPSHLTAILLITPLAMGTRGPISRSAVERACSWALTAATAILVFRPGQTLPLAFLPSVVMIWSAIRLGLRTTAAQLTFVAITVTVAMHVGGGFPVWASVPAGRESVVVQIYIFTTAIVLYLLAGALGEREAALIQVRASEELYRAGFAEANVGMLLIRLDSSVPRVAEVNATAAALLATRVDAPAPDGIATPNGTTIAAIAESLAAGQGWTGDMRSTIHVPQRWFSVSITRLSQLRATPSLASVQIVESTEHHHLRTQLERLALTDSLTNLPNRAALVGQLNTALNRARATSSQVAITFFDLDEFKLVNDVYGHLAGDELLREMADRFRSIVGEHVLARIGGDEFVLMCPAVDSVDEAMELSLRIVATMDRPVTLHGINHIVTISGGLAISNPETSSAQMLREADVALYAAKAAGKRRLTVYSPELGAQASDRVRIETELRSAIRHSEFDMHMQPVINVRTGAIEAAEALIRWHHPTDGLRPPGVWLDIAERSGMMPELGAWALDRSITEAAKWINAVGVDHAPVVHVNVSARQLDQPGFDEMVFATLERHRFPSTKLILELTETFLAHVSAELVDELRRLREAGVRIAADDFGTGYSPLTRIIELPISMIKIDRQFLWNAVDDPRSRAIVSSLLDLAATLDFDVVAEGVETSEQLDLLRNLGCRLGQGYLWSRPVPADTFLATLVEHGERSHAPLVLQRT